MSCEWSADRLAPRGTSWIPHFFPTESDGAVSFTIRRRAQTPRFGDVALQAASSPRHCELSATRSVLPLGWVDLGALARRARMPACSMARGYINHYCTQMRRGSARGRGRRRAGTAKRRVSGGKAGGAARAREACKSAARPRCNSPLARCIPKCAA